MDVNKIQSFMYLCFQISSKKIKPVVCYTWKLFTKASN